MSETGTSIIRSLKDQCTTAQKENVLLREQLKARGVELKKYKKMYRSEKYADSLPKYLKDWTTGHVSQFLLALGLGKYTSLFEANSIDGALLDGGFIAKADLIDLGMTGFDAAKVLTWVSNCRDAGGAVSRTGKALTDNEIANAVKYALYIDDPRIDCAISRRKCTEAIMKHPRLQALAQCCDDLKSFCRPKTFWKKFKEIDDDGTGFVTLKEIIGSIGTVGPQPFCLEGFTEAFYDILGQISDTGNVSKCQLLKALTSNSYNIQNVARQYGHSGHNPLLVPSQFHRAYDSLVKNVKENRVSFRALTIFFMRKHLAHTHGEGEVEEHSDTPDAIKDAVMQTEDDRQRRREEHDAMRATCYARLVIKLEQRQQEQAMKAAGPDGFRCLSEQVSAMARKLNALEGMLRTVHSSVSGDHTKKAIIGGDAKILRALANNVGRLEMENAETTMRLQDTRRKLKEKEDLEKFEAKHLADMRQKASFDMMVAAKGAEKSTLGPAPERRKSPRQALTKKSPTLAHLPTRPPGKPNSHRGKSQRQQNNGKDRAHVGKKTANEMRHGNYQSRRVGNVPKQFQSYNPEHLMEQKVQNTEKMMQSSSPQRKAFGRGATSQKVKKSQKKKTQQWERVPPSDWSRFR